MISVAACAGDASAVAASAANCKNLKTNFTGDYPCSAASAKHFARRAVINPRGLGFNPSGITAAHNTI